MSREQAYGSHRARVSRKKGMAVVNIAQGF